MREALRGLLAHLQAELPYTYVNLMGLADRPSSLQTVQDTSLWCGTGVGLWKKLVKHRSGTEFNPAEGADEYAWQLNKEVLAAAEAYDDGKRFIVRYRPFLRGFTFQLRLADEFTCFHPGPQLVPDLAYGMLQNMITRTSTDQLTKLPIYSPIGYTSRAFEGIKEVVEKRQPLVFY